MINSHAFKKIKFASHRAGLLSNIIHRIEETGNYIVSVLDDEKVVGKIPIGCEENTINGQLNIDLAELKKLLKEEQQLKITKGGYFLFYCSNGEKEYGILIHKIIEEKKEQLVFTSEKLNSNDRFIITPILPGTYTVASGKDVAGVFEVLGDFKSKNPAGELKPYYFDLDEKAADKKEIATLPGQPIVFTSKGPRLVEVTLTKEKEIPVKQTIKKEQIKQSKK